MAKNHLSFGVPTLDGLFSPQGDGPGIPLGEDDETTSFCLIGSDGTGKSVLALHMAQQYHADHPDARVLYVSTDLKHSRAMSVLANFSADGRGGQMHRLTLDSQAKALRQYLSDDAPGDVFIDLASSTAGDDWGFLNRLLASLPTPPEGAPRHLVLVDAVDGMETLVGEHDAFGHSSSRRQRIAGLLRLAERKVHLVLVVEDAAPSARNPEEFVADFVVRLRSTRVGSHTRRTLDIEKARGLKGYLYGQHPYHIGPDLYGDRDAGESGGAAGHSPRNTIEVFPALHCVSTPPRRPDVTDPGCGFGLEYLDEMVNDGRGIPHGRVAAIVGEPGTLKSELAFWFLARAGEPQGRHPAGAAEGSVGNGHSILLTSDPAAREAVKAAVERQEPGARARVLYCRELPLSDLPAAQVYWMIRRHLERAVAESAAQFASSEVVLHRLVIDDLSSLCDTYPEIGQDPLFLPNLLGLLESEIVAYRQPGAPAALSGARHVLASLLVATQEGRPDAPVGNSFAATLRNLVDLKIQTWRVRFYDQRRIAIATSTTGHRRDPILIRELHNRRCRGGRDDILFVDPHFELYRDVEGGGPERVALEVRMYSETDAFDRYIDSENELLDEIFVPRAAGLSVITKVPPRQYDRLRDFCAINSGTRLDHSLIIQVDEFWDFPEELARDERRYLHGTIVSRLGEQPDETSSPGREEDVLNVFQVNANCATEIALRQRAIAAARSRNAMRARRQGSAASRARSEQGEPTVATARPGREYRRSDFFVLQGRTRETFTVRPDRVPFMWDYGFLLLDLDAWAEARNRPLPTARNAQGEPVFVADVWNALKRPQEGRPDALKAARESREGAPTPAAPVAADAAARTESSLSWRVFLEAALEVARVARLGRKTSVQAFDAAVISGESLSSLVLEVWMSEIYLQKKARGSGEDAWLFAAEISGATDEPDRLPAWSLSKLLDKNRDELYMTFLLLAEALDFQRVAAHEDPYKFEVRPGTEAAVAARHWYKTAVISERAQYGDRPSMPARLPGHFSVRGDWYLAVASGSRSYRLADRGLDFLNSRRASLERLYQGLGLPLRDVCGLNDYEHIRTALTYFSSESGCAAPGRRVTLPYWDLFAELGACPEWLRTGLRRQDDEFYWLWRTRLLEYSRQARLWESFMLTMARFWGRTRTDQGGRWRSGFIVYDEICSGWAGGASSVPEEVRSLPSYGSFMRRLDTLIGQLGWISSAGASSGCDEAGRGGR